MSKERRKMYSFGEGKEGEVTGKERKSEKETLKGKEQEGDLITKE